MALLDLDVVKGHLRLLHDDEDTMVAVYQAAAEGIVAEYIDRAIVAGDTEPEGDDIAINGPITAAILLVTSDLFERREPPEKNEGEAMLSPVIRRLLAPYRVWRTFDECPPADTV